MQCLSSVRIKLIERDSGLLVWRHRGLTAFRRQPPATICSNPALKPKSTQETAEPPQVTSGFFTLFQKAEIKAKAAENPP